MPSDIPWSDDVLQLKGLFNKRDAAYINTTQQIVDTISTTVLPALYEVINVPTDNVKWIDFQTTDTLMVVVCSVGYLPSDVPTFISDMSGEIPDVPDMVEQIVRIGIPYEFVLAPPDQIVEYMHMLIENHKTGGPTLIELTDVIITDDEDEDEEPVDEMSFSASSPEEPPASFAAQFDPSSLTEAQRAHLLVFQHHTRGKVH